jgi:uncharacterized protein
MNKQVAPLNALASSSSAYLKSAAHQPIQWLEYSEAAFAQAAKEDKPILLDIGAVWCHWCHVIDRESYENEAIAAYINAHFIAIKVDRDQRPDIDARYQQVVAAMTGQGGWPLTGFLTYEGRVLYIGTYFTPEAMTRLLRQIHEAYHQRRAEIFSAETSEQLSTEAALFSTDPATHTPAPENLSQKLLTAIRQRAENYYDPIYGGFGRMPKFPHFSTLQFLLKEADPPKDILEKSLQAMALSGIYDHLGGGWHRYSVDEAWHVPHFEKMAYDNGEALTTYAWAYQSTSNPLYKTCLEKTLLYCQTVLCSPEQTGFYASQDADINLEDDGDYFTWTLSEVEALGLSPSQMELARNTFGLTSAGNMHGRPHRNVLRIVETPSAYAEFEFLCDVMRDSRLKRPTPFIDSTVYLNWNAMLIVGFFDAADALQDEPTRVLALKILSHVLETHVDPYQDIVLHSPGIPGFLEDYAWFNLALLRAYQATGELDWLELSRQWIHRTCQLFEDTHDGAFFDISTVETSMPKLLQFRRKPCDDTPSSSANAIMITALLQGAVILDEPGLKKKAGQALAVFSQVLEKNGIYVSAMGNALRLWLEGPTSIELVNSTKELQQAVQKAFIPNKILTYTQLENELPQIRICKGSHCDPPIFTVSAFQAAFPGR